MDYVPITDSRFIATLEKWFLDRPEILVLIRYSHAAGNRDFEFFRSLMDLSERLKRLPALACVTAFREPQLPLRGVVDDEFISKCIGIIPDGSEYLVAETVKRVAGHHSWFHHDAGISHKGLREDLEESRGTTVAAGLYPAWRHDNERVISALVPDENGIVKIGIY